MYNESGNKRKITFSDDEIINKIRSGGQSFEDMSMYLFDTFKGFIPKINQKLHLPREDINDAYADALVKCIQKIKDHTYRGESKLSSYFYSIFHNTAVDVSRKNTSNKNKSTVEIHEYDAKERDLMDLFEIKNSTNAIINLMDKMGDPCKKILLDWGYYGFSMDEIAHRSNLKNAQSARSMKYKCLKKLKVIITKKLGNDV